MGVGVVERLSQGSRANGEDQVKKSELQDDSQTIKLIGRRYRDQEFEVPQGKEQDVLALVKKGAGEEDELADLENGGGYWDSTSSYVLLIKPPF